MREDVEFAMDVGRDAGVEECGGVGAQFLAQFRKAGGVFAQNRECLAAMRLLCRGGYGLPFPAAPGTFRRSSRGRAESSTYRRKCRPRRSWRTPLWSARPGSRCTPCCSGRPDTIWLRCAFGPHSLPSSRRQIRSGRVMPDMLIHAHGDINGRGDAPLFTGFDLRAQQVELQAGVHHARARLWWDSNSCRDGTCRTA